MDRNEHSASYGDLTPSTYATLSATDIAEGVRSGAFTARAVVEAAIERIRQVNGPLNAMTVIRHDEALGEASALDAALASGDPSRIRTFGADGPLAGVPVAVKEEYDVAGLPTTLGGYGNSSPAQRDSEAIRRLRRAGAIIIGKTTMPEFGQIPLTNSERYGLTLNPWDETRSPGGSSGGSAVAVAAGMVPIGLGADGGGSIRIPAACCGLVGLKPARGRISPAPLSEHWHGLVSLGAITRTVADTAVVNDVLAGTMPSDTFVAPPLPMSHVEATLQTSRSFTVAWTARPATPGVAMSAEVERALRATVALLEGMGHHMKETRRVWPSAADAFLTQFTSGMAIEAAAVEHPELLEGRTRATADIGRTIPRFMLDRALRRSEAIARMIDARFLTHADVLLLPTLPVMTPEADALSGVGALTSASGSTVFVANTAIFNVSGHPALSLPAPVSASSLPIGMQFVARPGREDVLMALAAQIEQRVGGWPSPRMGE